MVGPGWHPTLWTPAVTHSVNLMSDSREDDRQLVQQFLARRDEASFLQLYRRHTPALYRMAWRMSDLPPAAVDDIIQDTWLRAADRLQTFRFESAVRTWLIGILIRCVREEWRRAARHPRPAGDALVDGGAVTTPHLTVDLERAVAQLPDGMREVFVLHDVEGLTHEEVGTCLGVTAGTSKSQLFAARQRLRLWFGRTRHGA